MKRDGLGSLLRVPRDETEQQHSTKDNQTKAVISVWLSVDPAPSWRRLVWALEGCKEQETANKLKPYLEPLSGEYCICHCTMQTILRNRHQESGIYTLIQE